MSNEKNTFTGYHTEKIVAKFTGALRDAFTAYKANPDAYHIKVSKGNSKMGDVPSFSLVPFLSCPTRCVGTCASKCYASKIANVYKNVLASYAMNQAIATLDAEKCFTEIDRHMKGARFFRFHVSGDILNGSYFGHMVEVVQNNPHCDTLIFTKRFEVVNEWIDRNGALPKNMHIIMSGWENLTPDNPHELPESYAVDFKSTPDFVLPDGWKMCGGNCFECACNGTGCFGLENGEAVCFAMH